MDIKKTHEPKTIGREYFGGTRFCLDTFQGRFSELAYFVRDAENCDENGHSKTVFQTDTKEKAVAKFGFTLTIDGQIVAL